MTKIWKVLFGSPCRIRCGQKCFVPSSYLPPISLPCLIRSCDHVELIYKKMFSSFPQQLPCLILLKANYPISSIYRSEYLFCFKFLLWTMHHEFWSWMPVEIWYEYHMLFNIFTKGKSIAPAKIIMIFTLSYSKLR